MESTKPSRIQFISSYCPSNTTSTKVRRRAHSHAARIAHAKARYLRTVQHQAVKTRQPPKEFQGVEERRRIPSNGVLSTFNAIEINKAVLPSPISLLAADWTDPFCSFAMSFKPIEHFLLDHYVRAVLPYMNITCNNLRDPKAYINLMTREWVRLTLTNVGSLNGVFLAACRHLLQFQQQYRHQYYIQLATRYKLLCMQALREAILSESSSLISDSSVSMGILLSYDELQLGDLSAFRCHSQGLIKMVEHNGGTETMGANGFLERLVCKYIGNFEPACKFKLKPW